MKEIKPFSELKNTYVPNSPEWLTGLVNLRGSLVPVIDLGIAFNIKDRTGKEHNVIILSIKNRIIGILVDAIGTIMDIDEKELEKPPSTLSKEDTKYISWVKRIENGLLVHLIPENLTDFGKRPRSYIEKRRFTRKETDISAYYCALGDCDPDAQWQPCRVLDISLGGMKIMMNEHLKMGTGVTVNIQDGKELDGLIVWARSLKDQAGIYTGVKFKESPDVINEKLHKIMEI
ncbi:MAG: chemotaxis protein CheW [Nitrospirae bacterium]|nr:chemotaxis protein CheW [Nitrospirota bacterium]